MINRVARRVALVTGGGKGIGRGVADALYSIGINVLICSRSKPYDVLDFESGLGARQEAFLRFVRCDVTNVDEVKQLAHLIDQELGSLDILINNCGGIDTLGTWDQLESEDWLECLNKNLLSAVNVCKNTHFLLKKSGSGKVINISSLTAIQPGTHNPHYAASKAALLVYSKNLSLMWAEDNILVNSVTPGIIETEGWGNYLKNRSIDEKVDLNKLSNLEYKRAVRDVPLKRMGQVSDVVEGVLYLTDESNRFVTGTNIIIDGGKYRGV